MVPAWCSQIANTHKSMWFMVFSCTPQSRALAKYFCVCSFIWFLSFCVVGTRKCQKRYEHLSVSLALPHTTEGRENRYSVMRLQCKDGVFRMTKIEINFCARLRFAATVIFFMNFDQTWTAGQLFYSEWGKKEKKRENMTAHCNGCFGQY